MSYLFNQHTLDDVDLTEEQKHLNELYSGVSGALSDIRFVLSSKEKFSYKSFSKIESAVENLIKIKLLLREDSKKLM